MAKRKRRAPPFDPERAAAIVAEADIVGDIEAAKRWKCSTRTIERYRARMRGDGALAADVAAKKKAVGTAWAAELGATLGTVIGEIKKRTTAAGDDKPTYRELVGAAKVLGELETVRKALEDDQQPGADRQGAAPAQDAGEAGAEDAAAALN